MKKEIDENRIILEKATFEFSQEASCCSDNDAEFLTVEYTADLGLDRMAGGFFVLKTQEWAVQDANDFKEIFSRIEKVLQ